MAKVTKRKKLFADKVEAGKSYDFSSAVALLKELSAGKFEESIDVAINLGIDPRKSDQVVRGATVMPNGIGKSVRVAVLCQGDKAEEAKAAGADMVGMEDLAEEIKGGAINFDVLIATPDSMKITGQLARMLGPKGLMPNPKTGTVTPDVANAVKNAKAGQVKFRADKGGVIHASIGKLSFEADNLEENLKALVADLSKAKPAAAKGVYFRRMTLSSTMGPGVTLDHSALVG
jgi:large subunit ribosomal protein L1